MFADLHLHTTESDGTWTPEQLVREATRRGLKVIAITDHDTTAGIEAALKFAPREIEVVPGIELSTVAPDGEEVHILGLWIDPKFAPLKEQLTILRQARLGRTGEILERLNSLGITLENSEVLEFAQKDVLSRSHIASALLARGVVSTKQEAFDSLIGQGAPAYVERYKLAPEDAVELILQSGGVPVLAHPGLLESLEILPSLIKVGLVGLEVVHPSHTKAQTENLSKLAVKWQLLPSGGSDCHGPGGKDQVYLGQYTIPVDWASKLAARRRG